MARGTKTRDDNDTIDYAFSVTQNSTNQSPTTDTAIDITGASMIAITADSTATANTSDDMDLNVITSFDNSTYDDGASAGGIYTSKNFGDADVVTFVVTPGPKWMKLRLDENNSGAASVTVNVVVTW